jgi:hypothetical protein
LTKHYREKRVDAEAESYEFEPYHPRRIPEGAPKVTPTPKNWLKREGKP